MHGKRFKDGRVWEAFRSYQENKGEEDKSYCQVYKEVNTLCRYWRTFPDTYFIFCHYQKKYQNLDTLRSFLPLIAYSRICGGGR